MRSGDEALRASAADFYPRRVASAESRPAGARGRADLSKGPPAGFFDPVWMREFAQVGFWLRHRFWWFVVAHN